MSKKKANTNKNRFITKAESFKYILELLIVAFGVFLGVLVSNWNSERKYQKSAEITVNLIIHEIENNIGSLNSSIEYLEGLKHDFDSIKKTIPKSAMYSPYFETDVFKFSYMHSWRGPGLPLLENSVYESAKLSGVFQSLSIEKLQLISSCYSVQESYSKFAESILDRLYGLNSNTKTSDAIAIIEILTGDNLSTEKHIRERLLSSVQEIQESR